MSLLSGHLHLLGPSESSLQSVASDLEGRKSMAENTSGSNRSGRPDLQMCEDLRLARHALSRPPKLREVEVFQPGLTVKHG